MTTANVWVAVGSANPCKVEAVRSAFEDLYASAAPVKIHVTSHNAPSNVSDQPYGDAETKAGAVNRANAAWEAAQRVRRGPAYAVVRVRETFGDLLLELF